MAQKPLNQSIFRLVVGLIVFTAITIFLYVWVATINQAQNRLSRDLSVAQNILEQVLQSREEQLYSTASILTSDFGFKQAVASADKGTIDSALLNFSTRIKADLMAIISLNKETITSYPDVLMADHVFPYPSAIEQAIKHRGFSSLMMLDEHLYQVIMLTIDAPKKPIALALIGFKLDDALLQELTDITKLETTLQVYSEVQKTYTTSTLPIAQMQQALLDVDVKPSWLSITLTNDIPYVSKQFTLADELEHKTIITLSEKTEPLFADLVTLQKNITVIGLLAILLATLLAAWFAKRLSNPLTLLGQVAKRIADGDYTKEINIPSKTKEMSLLSDAFCLMQTNIQTREQEIVYQARHDILTSLYNRHYVETLLDNKFMQNTPFVAIGINIFGFRGINDIFGYHHGDLCLKELAQRLSKLDGLAARLTGGELLWLPEKQPTPVFIEQLKEMLEVPVNTDGVSISLKVSVGLIYCPENAKNAEEVFKRMNIVLDEAQMTQKFILPYSTELEERYSRRLSIITELKHTLEHATGELSLNYQPKLDVKKNAVTHVEALIRWTNARLGFVSPEDFIAIAEQAGFIESITHWVINAAINDAAKFRDANIDVSVAINLSAKDIMNPALLPKVLASLKSKGLTTDALSFEITEGDLVEDHDRAIIHLQAYRNEGFEIAIDDFGTGYSSMAYLQNLPVNTLKVDKSFVLQLDKQDGDQKIVQTVINLAHNFDMNVVAEGVETIEALTLLAQWGCELAQGYYICKPIPADNLITWYKDNLQTNWL